MKLNEVRATNLSDKELNCDFSLAPDAERCFSAPCKFLIGTTDYKLFPQTNLAEFAFIGRSNVGKSSLLNALVKHNKLARVSVTPGRTQQANFFQLSDKMLLVDLPGYGFAKAPINLVKSWERMSLGYLKNCLNLKRLFLLIDGRHGFKKADLDFMEKLDEHAISYQIILTKLDKTNKATIESIINYAKQNLDKHSAMFPDIILSSSKSGLGILEVRTYMYNML